MCVREHARGRRRQTRNAFVGWSSRQIRGSVLTPPNGLDPLALFEPLLERLAEKFVAKMLVATSARMVAQAGSPLGTRAHRAAVKRRLANGEGGAGISPDGRRHLLTHEALQEELGIKRRKPPASETVTTAPKPKAPKDAAGVSTEHARELLARLEASRSKKEPR